MSGALLAFDVALATTPERVFAALTDAHELAHWFCDVCESEPRANGRLVLRWTRPGSSREAVVARWVEFAPAARAAFQGGHAGYPNGDAGTVWFSLVASASGTRLQVRHELPDADGYEAMIEPWRAAWPRALARLESHLSPVHGQGG